MSADPPTPIDPDFRIQLPNFEGPLDLLLYLVQKHELDVLDLPIAFVTDKYVEYLNLMRRLNLDVAAEYLLMAATLAHIKSKMLLPKPPEDQADEEGEEGEDPREELIRRLLEYQKYKEVAEDLGSRGVAGRDVFPRGAPAPEASGPPPLAEVSVFKLLEAFQKVAKRVEGDLSLEVTAERISIQQRIGEIAERLESLRSLRFEQLFENAATTYDLVVTFLALLEMAKMRMLRIYQADPESAIHLEYRVLAEQGPSDDGADQAEGESSPGGPEEQVTAEAEAPSEGPTSAEGGAPPAPSGRAEPSPEEPPTAQVEGQSYPLDSASESRQDGEPSHSFDPDPTR